ncbi:MAG: 4-hydroxythreonine-4-phosphate dehydrogenase PdxA [Candidatus Glassbacteria bacterium]|nr:4-hydroxythreonine-4-phosphate dehydrogenase PdxA [Candidatus Glassbacteria bacterium]
MCPVTEASPASAGESDELGRGKAPVLAVSMGDARGIGPEVLLKALAHPELSGMDTPLVFGIRQVLEAEAARLWPEQDRSPGPVARVLENAVEVREPSDGSLPEGGGSPVLRQYLLDNPRLSGKWAGRAIERAAGWLAEGRAAALVTAPIDKGALNAAGYHYPGHTEMLASLAGGVEVSMMLAAGALRVVPATTHIALAGVPGAITLELLTGQCRIIDRGLRELFAVGSPSIAVCGLNPHLGDEGLAGDEDRRVVAPAVAAARNEGLDVRGPFSADTVFVRATRGEFDAVLAMYHDQAMIPVKMHAFGKGVNVTLGLPYVRTSPDHGVALDIAGRQAADESSMVEALKLAVRLHRNQLKRRSG